jgi:hypothetical protein
VKQTIQVIRGTAVGLIILVPAVLVTGFLTAKPFILDPGSFGSFRRLHSVVGPVVFLPIFYVHSLAGIRYLLGRSRSLNGDGVKTVATILWTALVVGISVLYLARPPQAEATALEPEPAPAVDASVDAAPAPSPDAAPARAEAGGPAADGSAVGGDAGSVDATAPEPQPEEPAPPPTSERRRERRRRPAHSDAGAPTEGQPDEAAPGGGTGGAGGGEGPAASPAPPEPPTPPAEPSDPGKSPTAMGGATLVRERCSGCHGLDRVHEETRSGGEWRAVVARMVSMGARLDDAERSAVLRHLSSR